MDIGKILGKLPWKTKVLLQGKGMAAIPEIFLLGISIDLFFNFGHTALLFRLFPTFDFPIFQRQVFVFIIFWLMTNYCAIYFMKMVKE